VTAADDLAPRRRGRPRSRPHDPDADPREGIVAAAGALFASHGIEAVTMAQIAERAGLQQSSIYYWFRGKAEILASILERVNRIPLAIVERELAADGPVAVRLYRLVREDVLALCGFPFDINEIHRLAVRSPADFDAYWAERTRLDDEVESLVRAGQRSGELRKVDARLAARTLLASDEATQNWFRGDAGKVTAQALADHVAETALRGLLADPTTIDDVKHAASS
jgi:AcrR family transcriptional regulator